MYSHETVLLICVIDRTVLDRHYRQVADMFNLTTNDVVTMHS